jgi:hypothetical protein
MVVCVENFDGIRSASFRTGVNNVLARFEGDPTDDIRRRFFVMMDDLRLHDAAHRQPANVD